MFVFEQLNISSETKVICISEVNESKVKDLISAPGLGAEYFPLFIGDKNINELEDEEIIPVESKGGDKVLILKVTSDFPINKAVQEVETYLEIRDFDFEEGIQEDLELIYEDQEYEVFGADGGEYLKVKIGSSSMPFGDLDTEAPKTVRIDGESPGQEVFITKDEGEVSTLILSNEEGVYSFVNQGTPSTESLAKSIVASDYFVGCEAPEYQISLQDALPVNRYVVKADVEQAKTGQSIEDLAEKNSIDFENEISRVDKDRIENKFASVFLVNRSNEKIEAGNATVLEVEPIMLAQIASCSVGGTWKRDYTMLNKIVPEELEIIVSQNIYQDEGLIDSDDEDMGDVHRGPVSLKGMTFCLTGRFDQFKKQSDFAEEIEDLGGVHKQNMSGKVDALIKGDTGQRSTTGAIEEAENRGTPIIDYDGFEKLKHGQLGKSQEDLTKYAESLN